MKKDIIKYRTNFAYFAINIYCKYIAKLAIKCDETAVTKPLMDFVLKPLVEACRNRPQFNHVFHPDISTITTGSTPPVNSLTV